jgi:hypothetical protein
MALSKLSPALRYGQAQGHEIRAQGRRKAAAPGVERMSAKRQLMGEQWDSFARAIFNKDTPDVQRREMRRAFYAGGEAILFKILTEFAPDAEPTEADLQIMDDLHKELLEFGKLMQQGRA